MIRIDQLKMLTIVINHTSKIRRKNIIKKTNTDIKTFFHISWDFFTHLGESKWWTPSKKKKKKQRKFILFCWNVSFFLHIFAALKQLPIEIDILWRLFMIYWKKKFMREQKKKRNVLRKVCIARYWIFYNERFFFLNLKS